MSISLYSIYVFALLLGPKNQHEKPSNNVRHNNTVSIVGNIKLLMIDYMSINRSKCQKVKTRNVLFDYLPYENKINFTDFIQ